MPIFLFTWITFTCAHAGDCWSKPAYRHCSMERIEFLAFETGNYVSHVMPTKQRELAQLEQRFEYFRQQLKNPEIVFDSFQDPVIEQFATPFLNARITKFHHFNRPNFEVVAFFEAVNSTDDPMRLQLSDDYCDDIAYFLEDARATFPVIQAAYKQSIELIQEYLLME